MSDGPDTNQQTPAGRSLAQKTAWSALASVTAMVASALSSIIVARVLGPRGTGEVAYSLWLASASATIFAVGLPQTITRYSAELEGAGRARDVAGVARWLVRRTLASLVLGTVAVAGLELSRGDTRPALHVLLLILAMYLAQSIQLVYTAVLAGRQDFRRTSYINLAASLVQVSAVYIGSSHAGIAGGILGYAVGALLPAVVCVRFAWGAVSRPDSLMLARIRKYSLHTWFAVVASLVLWSRTEVFFLELWWGPSEVAMFTIGLTLAQLATQGPLLLGTALIPHFAQLAGAGDFVRVGRTYAATTRMMAFLLFPVCLGLAAISPVIIPLLFGDSFAQAAPNATVLVAVAALGATATVGSSLMYALERSRFIAISGAVGALVGLIVLSLAIRERGSLGAAWGRAGLQTALLAWGHWYLWAVVRVEVPIRALARIALSAGAAAAPLAISSRAGWGWAGVLLLVPVSAATYMAAIRWTRAVALEDVARLTPLLERLPPGVRRAFSCVTMWIAGGVAAASGK